MHIAVGKMAAGIVLSSQKALWRKEFPLSNSFVHRRLTRRNGNRYRILLKLCDQEDFSY